MIDAHTLSVAGFVSQATFALTFALLALSDRRTKGMAWLACGAILQLLVTSSRSLRSPAGIARDPGGAAVIILLFFFLYMGLRWFAVRREMRSRSGPAVLAIAFIVTLLLALISPAASLLAGRLVALVIISCTVPMLWSSRLTALRIPLRISALLLSLLGTVLLVRVLVAVAPLTPGTAHLADILREATMLSVTPLLLSFMALFVAETNRRLHDETRMDVLTGLRNRRALEEAAAREARECALANAPLALLMLDLDHFKQLNDTWGHALGDRALRTMGSLLLTVIGDGAVTARMGGEEFAVLLPGHELEEAAAIAERVRASVEDLRLAEGTHLARFTVSVGISVMHAGERTWTDMMARADDALYRAKREGRNRVAVAEMPDPSEAPGIREAKRSSKRSSWRKHLLMPRGGPLL